MSWRNVVDRAMGATRVRMVAAPLIAMAIALAAGTSLEVAAHQPKAAMLATGQGRGALVLVPTLFRPHQVSADSVEAAAGTPAGAVLAWARALQQGDAQTVVATYTRRAQREVGIPRLIAAVRIAGPTWGTPVRLSSRRKGPRAIVRATFLSWAGSAVAPRLQIPVYVAVRREGRRWLLTDPEYLLNTAADLRRLRGGPR